MTPNAFDASDTHVRASRGGAAPWGSEVVASTRAEKQLSFCTWGLRTDPPAAPPPAQDRAQRPLAFGGGT